MDYENELLTRIGTGRALLFCGAGFSYSAVNTLDENPPLAKNLAREICNLGRFDEDEDLRYAAEYYIDNHDPDLLIDLLIKNFSITTPSPAQVKICKANWRRYYTTNYDNSIELSGQINGKTIRPVSIHFDPREYYAQSTICVHLNGTVSALTSETLNTSFKLSNSSYITPDSFLNSDWYYPFKQDLERCSAIVFAGYSLYDIEIQKILFNNPELKEKTYFITLPDLSNKELFTLSKFGKVLQIGVDKFGDLINENIQKYQSYETDYLEAFCKFELSSTTVNARDTDITSLMLYGDSKQEIINTSILASETSPYVVERKILKDILTHLQKQKNIIITSDLGNGKTILIKELKPYLTVNSFNIYELLDNGADYRGDLEKILKTNTLSAIIIDDYDSYLDVLEHLSILPKKNLLFVCTARKNRHDRSKNFLREKNLEYLELNIDNINTNEAIEFSHLIDYVGLWGNRAGYKQDLKLKIIEQDNKKQFSLNLLDILNSPQIEQKINSTINPLLEVKQYKETVFSIALLTFMGLQTKSSLISEVANNTSIYESELRNNSSFNELFSMHHNLVISKSSIFCLTLLKKCFESSYIITNLQRISKDFSEKFKNSHEENIIFKSTLRFSFIERILADSNKKSNLYKYYEDLKQSIPWIITDPHYWVQYGMARILFKDYPGAQTYFDNAYGIALKRANYHTDNIDTQQGRLYLLQAIETHNHQKAHDLFVDAHKLFSIINDDIYKFRQVEKYSDYYQAHNHHMSNKNKQVFVSSCRSIIKVLESFERDSSLNTSDFYIIQRTANTLRAIVKDL